MTSAGAVAIVVIVLRRALEKFQVLLSARVAEPRLTGGFGVFLSPVIAFALISSLAIGCVGLLMWLLGIPWGPELMLIAMSVAGLFCMFGIVMISVLSVADVGLAGVLVARDAVRAARTVRRQRARPEAGQLAFPDHETEGGLSHSEAVAGSVTLTDSGADTLV